MKTPPDGENAWRSHLPTAPANENSRLSRPVIRVIALLALSALINYIDRGNLSIAAPLLKDELGLSASQLGILLSSFFWTYSLFLPVSGWLADRFDVKWVMAFGFFLWSGATAVTGGLHAFAAFAGRIVEAGQPHPILQQPFYVNIGRNHLLTGGEPFRRRTSAGGL